MFYVCTQTRAGGRVQGRIYTCIYIYIYTMYIPCTCREHRTYLYICGYTALCSPPYSTRAAYIVLREYGVYSYDVPLYIVHLMYPCTMYCVLCSMYDVRCTMFMYYVHSTYVRCTHSTMYDVRYEQCAYMYTHARTYIHGRRSHRVPYPASREGEGGERACGCRREGARLLFSSLSSL